MIAMRLILDRRRASVKTFQIDVAAK